MKKIGEFHGIPIFESDSIPDNQIIIVKPHEQEDIPVFQFTQVTGLSPNNEYDIITTPNWNNEITRSVYLKHRIAFDNKSEGEDYIDLINSKIKDVRNKYLKDR